MATAISKPASHTQKMKRPPPPFGQAAANGVKGQHLSSSPTSAAKRLPTGASVNATSNFTNGVAHVANSTNKGPLNRTRNQSQRPVDQSSRSGRPVTRTAATDQAHRAGKKAPEPYVKTTSYILKKYSKCPPSLIVHLHPTHFRFEQQDGSFPYNSEMKVIIEHIRAGTVPHDLIEELLRGGVQFYEGCLIVRVIDHKSVSAQARKAYTTSSNENNTPFSLHNYNEHVTPSAFVPYPKQNQLTSATQGTKADGTPIANQQTDGPAIGEQTDDKSSNISQKNAPVKPRVFTTVLHPTARTLQAELTLLVTTPDPRANKAPAQPSSSTSSATPGSSQPDRGHVAKRQKMLVEPEDLLECESKMIQALAPPLFLDPVHSMEAAQELFKHLESPLHCDPPPLPKRRKRTVAELAADEALAAEEERFMLIMDERLEPTASGPGGAAKAAAVDDAGGVAPFEPRFSRFKTLETIRMQHEEKAKREHEMKLKQELAKRQQQEQERERRRAIEQRQAEEHAKEESRRQQLAAQQAQAQLAAQQQNRHIMAQPNGVSQGQQSSPVVRNQTPHATSSPLVGNIMPQAVPMTMTASGSGSPPRPPSALQHAHPNVMSHPMAPSRSQQGPSRHGTPQMTQGTPAMSHATPIMRNVTPTQRMGHGSPTHSMGQTPVMNPGMAATPQMNGGMPFTTQQQIALQHRQQALMAQQGHIQHNQYTPQQLAHLQANAHAQQNIQSHHQMLQQQQQQQQQQQNHQGVPKVTQQGQQAYQAQLMRAQYAQMQIVKQQQQGQHPQMQGQQAQPHQGNPQLTNQQQQQMLMAAAQANGGQMGPNGQPMNQAQRYTQLYQQRLLRMRHDMSTRYMAQYGPPNQYPSNIAQQYGPGLEKTAKAWVSEVMRRERDGGQQQQQQRAALQAQQMQAQGSMHSMGGMNS